jgi:choline dehydrogenase-like flavoprotein
MRSPNPSRIINAPEYERFRWDTLQARRTTSQTPRLYWRGRGLGGSSAINGQIAIRGVPEDYDRWAAAGCTGWGFADVLPYFKRLETDLRYGDAEYHGNDGPIPIYRAPMSNWDPSTSRLASGGRSRMPVGARSQCTWRARRVALCDQQPRASPCKHERRVHRTEPRPQQSDDSVRHTGGHGAVRRRSRRACGALRTAAGVYAREDSVGRRGPARRS